MRYDNWLLLQFDLITVLSCQYIDLPLIHTQLAHVSLKEEDVCALHAWVKNLSRGHVIAIGSAHDLSATLYATDVVLSRDVNHSGPVLIGSLVYLLGTPQELHVVQVHPCRFPYFHEVSADHLDLTQISAHLVVEETEPISYPEKEDTSSLSQFVDVDSLHYALSNMHSAWRFESIVASEHWLVRY